MNIQIRNQFFTLYQIESFITPAVLNETETYKNEGNCWPDLWVKDCTHLSYNEQTAFIYLATYGKNSLK